MTPPQSVPAAVAGLTLLGTLLVASWAPAAAQTARRIELPTPADAAAPDTPLIVPRAGEVDVSTVPGPVSDVEVARIALAPDGEVAGVVVEQTLTLRGVGDFNVVLPGPATHVVGPADQATQPGLRRGTILWAGFVPGERTIRATATLDPAFERFRVPLLVSVRVLQDGRDVRPPVTGPVEIRLEITNNTGRILPLHDAVPRANDLAGLLDALRRELRAGRAPIAGRRGIARSLAADSSVRTRRVSVAVPFTLSGTVGFSSGSLSGVRVTGPAQLARGPAPGVAFRALLPSASFPAGTSVIRIQGTAASLGAPRLDMHAKNALPDPASLEPPGAATWRDALADASDADLRAGLTLAERTLWQALRLREFDAYLGNPGAGPSSTTYVFSPARAAAARAPVPEAKLRVGALALTVLAAAMAVANATFLWTRS